MLDRAGEHGECARLGKEPQVAVAALKGGFLDEADPGGLEAAARFGSVVVAKAVGDALGMRTPADALAVGVEDEKLDSLEPVFLQGVDEAESQALDHEGRGRLADEAAGVGKAGLNAHPSARPQVVAVGLEGEHLAYQVGAVFQRLGRLEQGRDVDPPVDPVEPGVVERCEQGERRLGLSDEKNGSARCRPGA